jgi:hypothetical protein
VSQHPYGKSESSFLPVKIGALFEATDSEHARFTPFVGVELFKVDQGAGQPVICFDAGVADQAIFASVGVKGFVKGAEGFGLFVFVMADFRPVTDETFGFVTDYKRKTHIAVGLGVTLFEF